MPLQQGGARKAVRKGAVGNPAGRIPVLQPEEEPTLCRSAADTAGRRRIRTTAKWPHRAGAEKLLRLQPRDPGLCRREDRSARDDRRPPRHCGRTAPRKNPEQE